MYIVPVGQNPSGSVSVQTGLGMHSHDYCIQTMSVARKKQIYDICVKYGQCIVLREIG
jgi:hypothetical protein